MATTSKDENENTNVRMRTRSQTPTSPDSPPVPSEADAAKTEPQTKSSPAKEFDPLAGMNPKWRNWWIRGLFTIFMFGSFAAIIIMGIKALVLLILIIQIKCYYEVISIGHQTYQKFNLPWFRTLSWYFLGSSNYFLYGEMVADYFTGFGELFHFFMKNHRLISYLLYITGVMLFVLSLRKGFYKTQFSLFAWYQITLLIILIPSHLIIQNMLTGLIWFFLPVAMVICNDCFAYFFGFFVGKTPLIKISPKKTWEGFIGGFFSTVVFSFFLCEFMCHYNYFICAPQLDPKTYKFTQDCIPNPTFQKQHSLTLHPAVQKVLENSPAILMDPLKSFVSLVGVHILENEIWMRPMIFHGTALACFSSLIAPFGGFFASGFKRAFKIKDFADTIPGHGGLMDRFDCQYVMTVFVNVYIASVVRSYNPNKLLHQVMFLDESDQIHFYKKLEEYLQHQGLLK